MLYWWHFTTKDPLERFSEFSCQSEDRAVDLKSVQWIQAMSDNDPTKLIRSIARDMGMSKFLIRQVVLENIQYFSCKMWKGQYTLMIRWWEKFQPGSNGELTKQSLYNIDENQRLSSYNGSWDSHMFLFIFARGLTHGDLHQVSGRGIASLVLEGGFWKILHLTKMLCATPYKQKPVLAVRKLRRQFLPPQTLCNYS